jgi:hypothetical protein
VFGGIDSLSVDAWQGREFVQQRRPGESYNAVRFLKIAESGQLRRVGKRARLRMLLIRRLAQIPKYLIALPQKTVSDPLPLPIHDARVSSTLICPYMSCIVGCFL